MLFGMLGFLGFLGCLVWLVVQLVRRKSKKAALIGMAVCFVLFVIGIVTDSKEDKPSDEMKTPDVSDAAPAPDAQPEEKDGAGSPDAEPAGNPDAPSEPASLDVVCALIETTLKENYEEHGGYEITHDDASVTVNVWIDGLAAEVIAAQQSESEALKATWETAKENTVAFAKSIREFMDTMGQSGAALTLNVLNDANHDNMLLGILEGVVIYDVMED